MASNSAAKSDIDELEGFLLVTNPAPATNLRILNLRQEMSGLQPTERWVLCFMGNVLDLA
jgi:hypothetical protein